MNKKIRATELKYKKLEDKVMLLPNKSNELMKWIKYDPMAKREKALILFLQGRDFQNICKVLDINKKDFNRWTTNFFDKVTKTNDFQDKIEEKKVLKTPTNYSSWNSKNIYDFWNQLRFKNSCNNKII